MKIKTMKAAILVELNKPLLIDEVELPKDLDYGQVLVKVHYSGICGSQIGEIAGQKGPDPYLPHLLGHEGSGTVVETGMGVKYVNPGDNVVMHWRKGNGIDSDPPKYKWDGKLLNAGFVTTFNEYAIVSENRLTRIPKDANLKICSLFGCAVTTGFGVVNNNAQLKSGESIVIFGSGGIGLNMVQAAALVSAYPIIAVDRYDKRLALSSQLGATHIINTSNENAKERILEIVGQDNLDVFIDNTGQPDIITMGYQITKRDGRVILVGVPQIGKNISIYSLPLHFGKYLSGSHGGEATPESDIPRFYKLYNVGKLPLNKLITETCSLEKINEAISAMISGKTQGRTIVKL